KRHDRVAKLGVFLHFEAERRRWADDNACKAARIEDTLFAVKFPRAVLLGLKAALQAVCEAADSALERLKLLVEISAQAVELDRVGEFLGVNLFVESSGVNLIIWIGVGDGLRRGRLHRGFAVGHGGGFACLLGGAFIHAYLGLRRVLLIFLCLLDIGISVFAVAVVLTGAVEIFVVCVLFGLII